MDAVEHFTQSAVSKYVTTLYLEVSGTISIFVVLHGKIWHEYPIIVTMNHN